MSLMRMNQTCTYWSAAVWDGTAYTFSSPVTLACRWQDGVRLVRDKAGAQVVSVSTVYLGQDVDSEGRLALGEYSGTTPPAEAMQPICVGTAVGISGAIDHWKVSV